MVTKYRKFSQISDTFYQLRFSLADGGQNSDQSLDTVAEIRQYYQLKRKLGGKSRLYGNGTAVQLPYSCQ